MVAEFNEIDGFLQYKGEGRFYTKKRFLKGLKLVYGDSFAFKEVDGCLICVPTKRYFNNEVKFRDFFDQMRRIDQFITGRIKQDDELLSKVIGTKY